MLCLLAGLPLSLSALQSTIYPTPAAINQTATYTINLQSDIDLATLGAGSFLTLQLPSAYYSLPATVYTCDQVGWTVTLLTPTSLKFTGLSFTAPSFNPQFSFGPVLNPNLSFRDISPFLITISNSSGGTLTSTPRIFQLTPGTLSGALTFSPSLVDSTATLLVAVTPTNQIPQNGYLLVIWPNTIWRNQVRTASYFSSTNPSCSSGALTLLCTVSQQSQSIQLKVDNLFPSSTSIAFSFSVQNILSAPTVTNPDAITITTYSPSGQAIDTNTVFVNNLTPRPSYNLVYPSSSLDSGNIVNAPSRIYFVDFQINTLFSATLDTITVKFDQAVGLSSAVVGFPSHFRNNASSSALNLGTNTFNIFGLPTFTFNIPETSVFQFRAYGLTQPPSVLPAPVQFTFSRNGATYVKFTSFLVALPGPLAASLDFDFRTVNAVGRLRITLTPSNPIAITGSLSITIPAGFTLTVTGTGICTGVTSTAPEVLASYSCSTAGSTVTVTNFLSTKFIPSSTKSITVELAGIKNPSTAAPTPNFQFSTLYQNIAATDSLSGLPFAATPGTLTLNEIAPSSFITSDFSEYRFNITLTNSIPVGGKVSVGFPTGVAILNSASVPCTSSVSASISCIFSPGSGSTAFVLEASGFPLVAAGTQLIITFSGKNYRNPISIAPTPSFVFNTMDSSGNLIDRLASGATLTMRTACQACANLAATVTQPITLAASSYQFALGLGFPIPGSTLVLQITLPLELSVVGGFSCSSTVISCTVAPAGAVFNLTLSTAAASFPLFSTFSINSLNNPASLQSRSLSVKGFVGGFLSFSDSVQVEMLRAGTLTASFGPNSSILKESISVSLSLTLSSSSQVSAVTIEIPPQYAVAGLSASSIAGVSSPSPSVSGRLITISGVSFGSSLSLTLTGLANPSTWGSNYFVVSTYSSSGFVLQESNNQFKFQPLCSFPCMTCQPTNSSFCNSCYSEPLLVQGRVTLDSASGSCVSACPLGSYSSGSSCLSCSSPCLSCSGASSSQCLSCSPTSANKVLSAGTCTTSCPAATFSFTDGYGQIVCSPCSSKCNSCSTDSFCISCQSNFYLQPSIGLCSQVCPQAFYPSGNVCTPCSNCLACTSASSCTLCKDGFKLNLGSCDSQCTGANLLVGNQCSTCDPTFNCLTCVGTSFGCQSCSSSSTFKFLLNDQCIRACPSLYFASSQQCQRCPFPCLTCAAANTCLTCVANFLLDSGACVVYCSPTKGPQGGDCSPCTSNCLTCVQSLSKCTSCAGVYSLFASTCINPCPAYQISYNNVCVKCEVGCATCSNSPSNCLTCISGYYLSSNSCVTSCGALFVNQAGTACVNCNPSFCDTCTATQTACLTCLPGKFLSSQSCVVNCPSGTYAETSNRTCTQCFNKFTNCLTCLPNACDKCAASYFVQAGQCVTSCSVPTPVHSPTGVCIACPTNCLSCDSTGTCSACSSTTFLENGLCSLSCLSPKIVLGGSCLTCAASCATCSGQTTMCTSCPRPQYLQSGSCIPQCTNKLVPSVDGTRCVSCSGNCLTCLSREDYCASCYSGNYLQGTSCVLTCSTGVGVSGVCVSCGSGCLQCTQSLTCLVCQANLLLAQGNCVASCPTSLPIANGTLCLPCSGVCLSCNASNYCFSCTQPALVYKGSCLSNCPANSNASSDGKSCLDLTTVTGPNSSANVLPIPCMIAALILGVVVLLSRFISIETKWQTALAALVSLPEKVSWLVLLAFQSGASMLPLTVLAVVLSYLANAVALLLHFRYLQPDLLFQAFLSKKHNHLTTRLLQALALLTSFRANEAVFSKLFGSSSFAARLQRPNQLLPLSLLTFVTLLVCHVPIVISAALFLLKLGSTLLTQSYMQAVDTILVTIFGIIVALINLRKPQDYFLSSQSLAVAEQTLQDLAPEGNDGEAEESLVYRKRNQAVDKRALQPISELDQDRNENGFIPRQRVLRTSDQEDMKQFEQKASAQLQLRNSKRAADPARGSFLTQTNEMGKRVKSKPKRKHKQTRSEDEGGSLPRVPVKVFPSKEASGDSESGDKVIRLENTSKQLESGSESKQKGRGKERKKKGKDRVENPLLRKDPTQTNNGRFIIVKEAELHKKSELLSEQLEDQSLPKKTAPAPVVPNEERRESPKKDPLVLRLGDEGLQIEQEVELQFCNEEIQQIFGKRANSLLTQDKESRRGSFQLPIYDFTNEQLAEDREINYSLKLRELNDMEEEYNKFREEYDRGQPPRQEQAQNNKSSTVLESKGRRFDSEESVRSDHNVEWMEPTPSIFDQEVARDQLRRAQEYKSARLQLREESLEDSMVEPGLDFEEAVVDRPQPRKRKRNQINEIERIYLQRLAVASPLGLSRPRR